MRNNHPRADEPRFSGSAFAGLFGTTMSTLANLAAALNRDEMAGNKALDRIVERVLTAVKAHGSQAATTPESARLIMITGLWALADAIEAETLD